jgi:hypothetical protein
MVPTSSNINASLSKDQEIRTKAVAHEDNVAVPLLWVALDLIWDVWKFQNNLIHILLIKVLQKSRK